MRFEQSMWKPDRILRRNPFCVADFEKPQIFHYLKQTCCKVQTRIGLVNVIRLVDK